MRDQLTNVQQIQATHRAFAAILGGGSVVTWGTDSYGGDSSAVQDQLKNVQQICASNNAFAAILGDGSVVTWSAAGCLGEQLKNVRPDQSLRWNFCCHSWRRIRCDLGCF